MVYSDGEILVHLKMEMGGIHAMVIADGANLLTSPDLLSLTHDDLVEMSVEGISEVKLPVLDPGMADDDNISPVCTDVPCQNSHPIPYGVDGASEALGTSSVSNPILPEMASCAKASRFVIAMGIRRSHRKVKSIRGARRGMIGGG